MNNKNNIVLECKNVAKSFKEGTSELKVISNINFKITQGEQAAIIGRSGSGKTTLLQLLGGLDTPTTGEVKFCGESWQNMKEAKRGVVRNNDIGFIYQMHHLLPEFNALENVAMPLLLQKLSKHEIKSRALNILQRVGLQDRVLHKPSELSGGERQRVAIARALVTKPKCVLADEPTGNLDYENSDSIFNLMCEINKELNTTFIIVTHDMDLADKMDVKYKIVDGSILV